jgi:tetratricopeptide (TPR) repeat protein
MADRGALDELYRYDLALILERAYRAGVQVALSSYPFDPQGYPHRAISSAFAAGNGLYYADVRAAFHAIQQARPDLDLYSADRGHPNALGYRVLATEVYKALAARPELLGATLAPPPDPLAAASDPAYLQSVLAELVAATAAPRADEYTWEARGHVEVELERWEDAERSFTRALELSGAAPQFVLSLATVYAWRGDTSRFDALSERTRALRGDRSDIADIMNDIRTARAQARPRESGSRER